MTHADIIRMAREARLAFDCDDYPDIWQTYMNVGREEIEHFAALVAAAERQRNLEMVQILVEAEREAVIAIVNDNTDGDGLCCADDLLAAIRARGEK